MLIYRFGNWKPSKVPIDDLFKATLIVLDIGIMEPRAQILGGVGIFDLEGLTMGQAMQMTPSGKLKIIEIYNICFIYFNVFHSVAQKMIAMMVTSLPYRWVFEMLKPYHISHILNSWIFHRCTAIHVVNQGFAFSLAFAFFKPFLNESMKSRLYLHGTNYKTLHEHINPENLPKRYGGLLENEPLDSYKPWIDYCKTNERVIRDLELHGYCVEENYNVWCNINVKQINSSFFQIYAKLNFSSDKKL